MKKHDSPKAFAKGKTNMQPAHAEKVSHGKGMKPQGGAPAAHRKGHSGMGGKRVPG